jgi:hypothetical protein
MSIWLDLQIYHVSYREFSLRSMFISLQFNPYLSFLQIVIYSLIGY